jgi:ABC-type uncharacterized transport system ATPase subunit
MTARLGVLHLGKRFGELHALDDVSLEIQAGQLHCLLGENGAGKSTLSSCLYGLFLPDEGQILLDGAPQRFRSPADAIRAGIGMVHQHFVLVPRFTVLENILVGTGTGLRLDLTAGRRRVVALCRQHGLAIDPDAVVENLSVGEQQWVEIVKALYLGARVLILDEPTAVLTPQESDRLFALLRRMTEGGLSVLFISHKMNEVLRSDQVTVLRRGKVVGSLPTLQTSREELTFLMIGRSLSALAKPDRTAGPATILEVDGLHQRDERGVLRLQDVNLSLRAGEVLGLAGVAGNGQRELFEVIAGGRRAEAGDIRLDGTSILGHGPRRVAELGIGHVPEDRLRDGLVPDLSIAENLILGRQWNRPWRRGLLLDGESIRHHAGSAIADYGVVTTGPDAVVRRLSGGNAQKVILARELAKASRCLLCNQPMRGLDVGIIEYVRSRILAKRDQGVAVLLASEELEELAALSDRIAVIFRGRIMGVLSAAEADFARLGQMMAGLPLDAAA